MSDESDDYKVGKNRPPLHTRFKSGQVSNPYGRRGKAGASKRKDTESSDLVDAFYEVANRKREVVVDGKKVTMKLSRVVVEMIFQRAQTGDEQAMKHIMNFMKQHPEPIKQPLEPGEIVIKTMFMTQEIIWDVEREHGFIPPDHMEVLQYYMRSRFC